MIINKDTLKLNTNIFKKNFINKFLKTESASGVLLIIFSITAIILTNSDLSMYYDNLKNIYFSIKIQNFQIKSTMHHLVNDGLMSIFFLVIGLELKREIINGQLSSLSKVLLPSIAALGGMIIPAAIYLLINQNNPIAVEGWAIPTATDIAFSLAILSLLGNKIPITLKIFLLSVAIADDLGAVIVIAIYYTSEITHIYILYSFLTYIVIVILNFLNIRSLIVYLLIGFFLWYFVLKSGVHSTIAGVLLATTIPFSVKNSSYSPLKKLEEKLYSFSGLIILPIFAFFNAGINLDAISFNSLLSNSIPLGIMLGLLIGKPVGITFLTYFSVKLQLCKLPSNINIWDIIGVSFLCGIGFTMSLFINNLAFISGEEVFNNELEYAKSGIFFGSLLSGLIGYTFLKIKYNKKK